MRSLELGTRLEQDIYDDNDVLLLAAGARMTARRLRKIRARGLRTVTGRPPARRKRKSRRARPTPTPPESDAADVAAVHGIAQGVESPAIRQLDDVIEEGFISEVPDPEQLSPAAPRLSLSNLREEADAARDYLRIALDDYANVATDLIEGRTTPQVGGHDLLRPMIHMIRQDRSLGMLVMNLRAPTEDFLFNHGLNTAILSMTVAARLGYDDQQVLALGAAALFQDVGMLRVPESIRLAPRKLTDQERLLIELHPVHTVNALERTMAFEQNSLLASYQAHERCDGSGYPRRRTGMFIHPLAKIVGVVDTFAAVICSRPYRGPLTPYAGVELLLGEAQAGHLDRKAVRALLDCTSLFPIGSRVRLSDGTIARVLRSNGAKHTAPVVVPLNPDGTETDEELDLARTDSLRVAASLDG
ncbi:MAG: HD domain-containing phosphohydrolase [Phycisphaeraceae bacterium]